MSQRNGDRSRAHRLRKAKIRRRAFIRGLQSQAGVAGPKSEKPEEKVEESNEKPKVVEKPPSKPNVETTKKVTKKKVTKKKVTKKKVTKKKVTKKKVTKKKSTKSV